MVAIVVHACMRGGGGGREVVPEVEVAMVAMVVIMHVCVCGARVVVVTVAVIVIVHVCIAVVGGRW